MAASPSPSSIFVRTAATLSSLESDVGGVRGGEVGRGTGLRGEVLDELRRVLGDRHLVAGGDDPDAGLARSNGVVSPPGLSVGVMTVSSLPAKTVGSPAASPASTSFCGLVVSADRKTSAGAPSVICVARAADESVEMVSVEPGTAAS